MNRNDKEYVANKIRSQYEEKQPDKIDELRALDARVKRPANVFAYIFGSLAAIIMGCGMSLIMTDIGGFIGVSEPLVPGIIIGSVGMLMAIINYPVYTAILGARKKKYAPRIIELSDKLTGKGN